MKDISIGGVIMLDRPELGADEKEEVSRFKKRYQLDTCVFLIV